MAARSYLGRIAQPVPAGRPALTARPRAAFDDAATPVMIVADETTAPLRPLAAARSPAGQAAQSPPPAMPAREAMPAPPDPEALPTPPPLTIVPDQSLDRSPGWSSALPHAEASSTPAMPRPLEGRPPGPSRQNDEPPPPMPPATGRPASPASQPSVAGSPRLPLAPPAETARPPIAAAPPERPALPVPPPSAAPFAALPLEPRNPPLEPRNRRGPRIHIGTVEVRTVVRTQAPAPAAAQPARLPAGTARPPTAGATMTAPLARPLGSHYGLVQS